jgi:adenylate kinase family enzyme
LSSRVDERLALIMNKPKKNITLLWGLPGSGKTTYAKELEEEDKSRSFRRSHLGVNRIDIDNMGRWNGKLKGDELIKAIAEEAESRFLANKIEGIILDGLIVTNPDARKILSYLKKSLNKFDVTFSIVWWLPDKDSCLWNDRGRRAKNSVITIKNLPFEEPSAELLSEFGITASKGLTVERKPYARVWMDENGVAPDDNGFITSDSWSLGGTYGSCWNDEIHHVSPGEPLTCFREFDELIEKVAPDINFLKYKRLYSETVTSQTRSEGDYYGGTVTYAYLQCDVNKLYGMLKEYGLIKEQ